ncbi:MAG: hypothetical protein ACXVGQ_00345 [Mycobacteriaceae bacterium]
MAQSIGGVVDALFTACQGLYANTVGSDNVPALVCVAKPGQFQPNTIIAVGWAVRQPQILRPTMGPGRSREVAAEIDVVMSYFAPGDESAQITALDGVHALQAQLDTYLRTGTNNVLGGACRDAYVSAASVVPDIVYQGFDDPNVAPAPSGRVADNTVTVTAFIRY